jgi:hypothetical protein
LHQWCPAHTALALTFSVTGRIGFPSSWYSGAALIPNHFNHGYVDSVALDIQLILLLFALDSQFLFIYN